MRTFTTPLTPERGHRWLKKPGNQATPQRLLSFEMMSWACEAENAASFNDFTRDAWHSLILKKENDC
jgi:hypothetical protein